MKGIKMMGEHEIEVRDMQIQYQQKRDSCQQNTCQMSNIEINK